MKAENRDWGMGLPVPVELQENDDGWLLVGLYPDPAPGHDAGNLSRLHAAMAEFARQEPRGCRFSTDPAEYANVSAHVLRMLDRLLGACATGDEGDAIAAMKDQDQRLAFSRDLVRRARVAAAELIATLKSAPISNEADVEIAASLSDTAYAVEQIADRNEQALSQSPSLFDAGNLALNMEYAIASKKFAALYPWQAGSCHVDAPALANAVLSKLESARALAEAIPDPDGVRLKEDEYYRLVTYDFDLVGRQSADMWWPGLLMWKTRADWMVGYWTNYSNVTLPSMSETAWLVAEHQKTHPDMVIDYLVDPIWSTLRNTPVWDLDGNIEYAVKAKSIASLTWDFDPSWCTA